MQKEDFTKYEIARILGARALQLSMDAPMLIKMEKEDLEKINYDPIKIAETEFNSGVLPITVKRPLPRKIEKKIKREGKKEEDKEIEKKEVVKKEEDKEIEKKEVVAEKEIKEEGEIMELAQPEDELEEVAEEEEAGMEE